MIYSIVVWGFDTDNARQASDSAIDYISKLPFVSHVTVISVERK